MRSGPDRLDWPAATACVALMALAPCVVLAVPRGEAVAVFAGFGDQSKTLELIARAGGSLVRADGAGQVAIARPADDRGGFVGRLYGEGAWLVFDPIIVGGCSPRAERAARSGV